MTPSLNSLVATGIELNRFYAYHMCSPTRSALQTGRHPMHVNIVNADPTIYNVRSLCPLFSSLSNPHFYYLRSYTPLVLSSTFRAHVLDQPYDTRARAPPSPLRR